MLAEQQWEYCTLWLAEARKLVGKEAASGGLGYECYVVYHCPARGDIMQPLADIRESRVTDPFSRAMALLGLAGWEMLSLQTGNRYGGNTANFANALIWYNRVAVFKRPVAPGRSVDEPPLEI